MFGDGVLAGGQILDVDFSRTVGGKGFRIPVALHQEGEALQHAVLGGLLNQQAALGGDDDGLILVVDVGMGGNLHPVLIQRFKHHNGGTSQGAGIQSISQFYGSNGFFRSELHLCSNFRAVYQEGLSCAFVHEDAGNGVGLSRNQAGVLHHVHNGDFARGVGSVLAIHRGGGAQGGFVRFGDFYGLCLVVNVRMGGNLHPIGIQRFKHYNGGAS